MGIKLFIKAVSDVAIVRFLTYLQDLKGWKFSFSIMIAIASNLFALCENIVLKRS